MLAGSRRFLPFLLALALLTACGGAPAAQPTAAPAPTEAPAPTAAAAAPTTAPAAPAAAGYPVTIENCGRTLTFERAPERVFTGYQPVFELMAGLGLGDRIAFRLAWPERSLTPFLPGQQATYDRAQEVSDTISMPQREAAVSLGADLVVSEGYYNFNAERGYATIEEFAQNGTATYIVGGWCSKEQQDDYTVDVLYQDIRNLGQIFAVPDQAEALIAEMQASVADAEERVRGLPKLNVYAYDSGEGPLYSYGGGMMQQTISRAGGENLFKDEAWFFEANIEAVAATNPDAFVIVDYPPTTAEEKVEFLCTRVVPESNACKERRYVAIPAVAFHPGYRNPFAVAEIARVLHPDAFETATAAPATAAYPVTIENCGNTLTFDAAPERVAPLYPPVTEMLLLLGLSDRIVGIGGSGAEPVLPELQAAYQALPRLAESSAIPREVLLAAEPQLVMDNQPDYFYDASQGFATREEIAGAGAQIYTLTAKCDGGKLDATMEDVYTDLRNIGAIFGVSEQAEAEIAEMQARIAAVTEKLAGVEPVSVIYYDAGEGPLGIFGPGTWEYVFQLAGATNAFSDLSESYAQLSVEEVATRDADVIVVAGYEGGDRTSEERAAFIRATFPNTQAVRNDRVIIIPYEYTNPGIQNVLGVEALARALHPERFE